MVNGEWQSGVHSPFTIYHLLIQIRNFPYRPYDVFEIRKRKLLEIFRVWHGHIDARNPLHRCIEIIKSVFSDLRANLCPYSAERMGLFSDYYAIRLLD